MKPLGLLVIIAPILLIIAGLVFLNRSKNRTPVDISTKIIIMILAIAIGAFTGFLLFIPVYLLFCVIIPNVPVDGHAVMPIGQVFFGSITCLIIGVIAAIVAYLKIVRWQVSKYGELKQSDSYRIRNDRPKKNY